MRAPVALFGSAESRSTAGCGVSDGDGFERWVVVLAGGVGSRFWPVSTAQRPKQLLPLSSSRPLIVETLERAFNLVPQTNVLILSGERLRPSLEDLTDLPSEQLLLEPIAKGTAPALAWAAHEILARAERPENAVMASLHSDHVLGPTDRFVATLERALGAAGRLDRLLTIGVRPTRAETGYGYIEVGEPLEEGVFEVRRFVEKPDRQTAERYVAHGGYLWNSGIFAWRPQVLLAQISQHTPELAQQFDRIKEGDVAGFFNSVPTLTIDHAVMERSSNIAMVESAFDWDDVGAWAGLKRIRELDDLGNVLLGNVHVLDCKGCVLWGEDGPIVGFGLEDLVIARASGITFVAPLTRANDLKDLLAKLPESLRGGDG